MTTCLGKSCLVGLLCLSVVNVYQFLCVTFFPFWLEVGMWDVIELIPDHFLSIYFAKIYLWDNPKSVLCLVTLLMFLPLLRSKANFKC